MDTTEKGGEGNEMTTASELEHNQLCVLEDEMFQVERRFWRDYEKTVESADVGNKQNKEYLRIKENIFKKKGKFFRKRKELLRLREEKIMEELVKSREMSLAGNSLGLEREISQLLPGIPNEVTFADIITKLSWRDVHLLQGVSWSWYTAIRDRLVYDARVHFHLTEAFVLLEDINGSVVLHCLRDNSYVELPKIPHRGVRSPYGHDLVTLDGKVYFMQGAVDAPSDKVYMLDLPAQQRSWTQVASMHIARSNYACGEMGGKIYVLGGRYFDQYVCESEVYDPKENTWSFIKPMCSIMWNGVCDTLGEELLVHGGTDGTGEHIVELYHPFKDEWRKVESLARPSKTVMFVSQGKVYSMDSLRIWVYSFEGNSWTQVCSHSFTEIQSDSTVEFLVHFVVVVTDDTLLAFGDLLTEVAGYTTHAFVTIGSTGFPTEKDELEWRIFRGWSSEEVVSIIYPIHL